MIHTWLARATAWPSIIQRRVLLVELRTVPSMTTGIAARGCILLLCRATVQLNACIARFVSRVMGDERHMLNLLMQKWFNVTQFWQTLSHWVLRRSVRFWFYPFWLQWPLFRLIVWRVVVLFLWGILISAEWLIVGHNCIWLAELEWSIEVVFFLFFLSKGDHRFNLRSELIIEVAWLEVVLDLVWIPYTFAPTLLLELWLALF